MHIKHIILPFLAVGLLAACKPKPKQMPIATANDGSKGTYFSINQYIKDQWNTYLGQPYSIIRVRTHNGKTDSTYLNAYNLEWGDILRRFFESDIGKPQYIGHYNFDMFLDNSTGTRNFYYEAKDDTQFTRKLQISAMQENNKIRSIYIETERRSGMKDMIQKLYYAPLSVIQIQEYDALATGDKNQLVVAYYFM